MNRYLILYDAGDETTVYEVQATDHENAAARSGISPRHISKIYQVVQEWVPHSTWKQVIKT
jgi:hypothetical protein